MTIPQSITASPIIKRSVVVNGHKTSLSLEEPFWQGLKRLAAEHGMTPAALITLVEGRIETRRRANLSATLRQVVFADAEKKAQLLHAKTHGGAAP